MIKAAGCVVCSALNNAEQLRYPGMRAKGQGLMPGFYLYCTPHLTFYRLLLPLELRREVEFDIGVGLDHIPQHPV